jgi:hypothetical protein
MVLAPGGNPFSGTLPPITANIGSAPGGVTATTGNGVDFHVGQAVFAVNELSYAPGFASAFAYVVGVLFAFGGILKLKTHAEIPTQVPITHGLARLAAAGALLSLPTITTLVQATLACGIGTSSYAVAQAVAPILQ